MDNCTVSGIKQFVELADKLDRRSEGLVNMLEFGLSNGRIEAVNNKVKVLIRMGVTASLTSVT
jgi:transposase